MRTSTAALLPLAALALGPAPNERGPRGQAPPPLQLFGQYCVGDLDCSLNGVCDTTTGFCKCDPAWSGPQCGVLNLLPAKMANGYAGGNGTGTSSWGGSVIADPDDAGKYHMFVGEMTGSCGLNSWWRNECFTHAVADAPDGPYAPAHGAGKVCDVTPPSATCPHAKLWNGTYLIFHTSCGTTSEYDAPIANCAAGVTPADGGLPVLATPAPTPHTDPTPAPTPPPAEPAPNTNPYCGGGSTAVFYSASPDGPWQQKAVAAPSPEGGFPYAVANPTAHIFENGTTILLYRSYSAVRTGGTWNVGAPYPGYTLIGLGVAPHWSGPYMMSYFPIFDNMNEDPHLYRDFRGNFHAVFHGMDQWGCGDQTPCRLNVGRHAFSEDGLQWVYSRVNAWTTKVEYEDGSTVDFARRERPEMILDADGHITHLLSGVVDGRVMEGQQDRSFTIVVPVCTNSSCVPKS